MGQEATGSSLRTGGHAPWPPKLWHPIPSQSGFQWPCTNKSRILPTHLRYEYEAQHHGRGCWKTQTIGSPTHIDEVSQSQSCNNHKYQNNACNVDDSWYLPRVVEALDLDFPDAECKNDCNRLQHNLVAVDNPKKDKSIGWETHWDVVYYVESFPLPFEKDNETASWIHHSNKSTWKSFNPCYYDLTITETHLGWKCFESSDFAQLKKLLLQANLMHLRRWWERVLLHCLRISLCKLQCCR